jgi:hypothetical protein
LSAAGLRGKRKEVKDLIQNREMQSKNCPPIRILFIFICLLISVVAGSTSFIEIQTQADLNTVGIFCLPFAVPRVGVNVGLTPNTDFIASDGVVQQSWQNGQVARNC